jgi:cytidylate kinase
LPLNRSRRLIVTLDGPAGAGKSSLAKRLARRLDLIYLESGALYRAIGLLAERRQGDLLSPLWLSNFLATFEINISPGVNGLNLTTNGENISNAIRDPQVSQAASQVATLRPVRQWVQARLGELARPGGVIAEGRDMGTRVFPEAEVKIFLTAALEVRAHRRWLELKAQGKILDEKVVCQDMSLRDQRDQEREEDPLRIPMGAQVIDNTIYNMDQVEEICLSLIQPFV